MFLIDQPLNNLPENNVIKGIVLLAPGLNQSSSSLATLRNVLQKQGLATCQLQLTGLGDNDSNIHSASRLQWLDDFDRAYSELQLNHASIPRYFLGYSLGATLGIDYLMQHRQASFEAICLMAPALALHKKTLAIRLLLPLAWARLAIPSLAPAKYRANSRTSLRAYRASFEIVDYVRSIDLPESLAQTPTTIVLSSADQLIDYRGVENWLSRNKLTEWELIELTPEHNAGHKLRSAIGNHLLFDPNCLGEAGWDRLRQIFSQLFTRATN